MTVSYSAVKYEFIVDVNRDNLPNIEAMHERDQQMIGGVRLSDIEEARQELGMVGHIGGSDAFQYIISQDGVRARRALTELGDVWSDENR